MSEELERGIPKGKIIGYCDFTEEEEKENEKRFERILKHYGILKENQSLKDISQD